MTSSANRTSGSAVFLGLSSKSSTIAGLAIAVVLVALISTIGAAEASITFRACFGALLAIFGCVQLYVAVVLFINRRNSLLELSQPVGLSIFALSGSIATGGAFLLALPEIDVACALRQPIILSCVSLMGSILVARSWRIGCIVSPTLAFSSIGGYSNTKIERISAARLKVMRALSMLSRWTLVVGSCGRHRVQSGNDKGIRQQITAGDSMRVAFALMLPQIILQIINVSVPKVRMQSVVLDDDLYACQCEIGPWLLALGTILATLPFFLALLLNVKSEGMPDLFREFDQIATSVRASIGVLWITLPTIAMVANVIPNAYAYLLAGSLLSFILPLCYHIAWLRMSTVGKGNLKKKQKEFKQKTRQSSIRPSGDDLEALQLAEDASTMGKMFETMGREMKATEVSNDILSMFKKDGEYSLEGGFTDDEISSFGPKTLTMICATLVSNSKRLINHVVAHVSTIQGHKYPAVKSLLDALSIFEQAPAKDAIKDRSAIFPGYSMFGLLACERRFLFNKEEGPVTISFLREAQFQQFHWCRAIAMRAVFLVRKQDFNAAFDLMDKLKSIYDPSLHSSVIMQEYGTDHCATTIAVSALWHRHLSRRDQALETCEHVIERILPEVAETNVDNCNLLGVHYILIPIILVLRAQGQVGAERAKKLYDLHVVQPFNSGRDRERSAPFRLAAVPLIRPMTIILTCCSNPEKYDGIEDDITWMLNGEAKFMDVADPAITHVVHWSFYSIFAEVCLHLAKRLNSADKRQSALVEEGLRLSGLGEERIKDKDGNVTNAIAFDFNTSIHSELRNFNDSNV